MNLVDPIEPVVHAQTASPTKRIRAIIPNRNKIGYVKLFRKSGLFQKVFSERYRIHQSQIQLWNSPEHFDKLLNSTRFFLYYIVKLIIGKNETIHKGKQALYPELNQVMAMFIDDKTENANVVLRPLYSLLLARVERSYLLS